MIKITDEIRRGALAFLIVLAFCGYLYTYREVPDRFYDLVLIVCGFYFGSKNDKKEVL